MGDYLTRVVRLAAEHDRSTFDSGEASLDEWLRRTASQAAKKDTARTFVVVDGTRVMGYYALCTYSVEAMNAPDEQRVGHLAIPSILLARLAVDRRDQGSGLGRALLVDAMARAVRVADDVAAKLFVVHALHERAGDFYVRNGFRPLAAATPLTMYLPFKDIRKTFAAV